MFVMLCKTTFQMYPFLWNCSSPVYSIMFTIERVFHFVLFFVSFRSTAPSILTCSCRLSNLSVTKSLKLSPGGYDLVPGGTMHAHCDFIPGTIRE